LESHFGRQHLRFPKEIILLGGAPGAPARAPTPPHRQNPRPDLHPDRDELAARHTGDEEDQGRRQHESATARCWPCCSAGCSSPNTATASSSTAFPAPKVQVECLKMLYEKMTQLWREFYGTPLAIHFRQPVVQIVVLFVDEKESVARQIKRGVETKAHNDEVRRSGHGVLHEERVTDFDEKLARRRYRVFKEQTGTRCCP